MLCSPRLNRIRSTPSFQRCHCPALWQSQSCVRAIQTFCHSSSHFHHDDRLRSWHIMMYHCFLSSGAPRLSWKQMETSALFFLHGGLVFRFSRSSPWGSNYSFLGSWISECGWDGDGLAFFPSGRQTLGGLRLHATPT